MDLKNLFKRKKHEPASEGNTENNKLSFPKRFLMNRSERSYTELSREYTERLANPEELVLHNVDPVFLVLFIVIAAFAFVVSLSATNAFADTFYDDKFYFVVQNVKFLFFGSIMILLAVYFSRSLKNYAIATVVGFAATILLLLLVLVIGKEAGGAKRWLQFGSFSIQPSEIAKTALVLILALFMSVNQEKIRDRKNNKNALIYGIVIPLGFIGLICGLVFLEKHNSGMIILGAIGLSVMFIGGSRKSWLIGMGIVCLLIFAVLMFSTGHGMERITSWLDTLRGNTEITDENWQSTQGLYAISSGGLFGLGAGQSRLKYGYVSQPQNDFIFPIICEELGFFGGVAVLLLFLAIFLREMKLALNANNLFVSITIAGLAIKLILQVLLNICVVTGIIPNTGISLPLFSAGGSAMIFQMLEFGIVLGLSRYCDVK